MADTKISGLAAVTDVLPTDEFVLARSSTTKKIDASDLAAYLAGVRTQLVLDARGLLAETIDEKACNLTSAPAAGTMVAGLVGLRSGDSVTGVAVHVTANGASVTLAKVALYDTAGGLLASSADVDSTFTSGSVPRKQMTAFTSPYSVVADGAYYLAFLSVGGTSPTVLRANSNASAALTGESLAYAAQAGQTDVPGTATLVSASNSTWLGAY